MKRSIASGPCARNPLVTSVSLTPINCETEMAKILIAHYLISLDLHELTTILFIFDFAWSHAKSPDVR